MKLLHYLCLAMWGAWAASCQSSVDLAQVRLYTPRKADIPSDKEWLKGCSLSIVTPQGESITRKDVDVKLRGHSTATKAKKPYTIKLDEKSALMGLPQHKRWVLLANVMDHSHMRNALALAIARHTCMAFTPGGDYVELYINNDAQGLYYLCEQIRVGEHRLNIHKKKGWLLELDTHVDGPGDDDPYFYSSHRCFPIHVKAPNHASADDLDSIEAYINTVESLLYVVKPQGDVAPQVYDYIDINSFVDAYIIYELTQNAEPNGPRSCYMHKDVDGKLTMGPMWDFDLAFNDVGVDSCGDLRPARFNRTDVRRLTSDSLYISQALWYDRLLQDSVFKSKLKDRWATLSPLMHEQAVMIDQWQARIEQHALVDREMWKDADPARFDNTSSFQESVNNLKRTYLYRLQVLDALWK